MSDEYVPNVVAQKLFSAARGVMVVILGLLPLLFIPSIFVSLPYTKIFIATIAVFLSLILFVFSTLRQGSIRTRLELPIVLIWVVFGITVISALFSGDFFDSFWGSEVTVHSAVFTGVLALIVTLSSHLFVQKKSVMQTYLLLAVSALALGFYHVLRIFLGADFLSFGIFSQGTASPFSEWNSLAIFFGLVVILSLIALEQLSLRMPGRILFAVVVALSLVMLAVISFTAVFYVLALVSLVTLLYALTKGTFSLSAVTVPQTSAPAISIFVSLATLLISIVFIVGGSVVGQGVSKMTGISYIEVRPSVSATIGIARQVYTDHALLGTGPNNFLDAWRLYHDPAINSTIFWNTNFPAGYGFIPTVFVTHGVLGGFAWVLFLASLLYVGVRTFLRALIVDTTWYFIAVSSYAASIYLWGMSIVYVPGPVLMVMAALCTGIFLASRVMLVPQGMRQFSLLENQQAAFITVGATVLVIVISVGSLYFMGRHYMASYLFTKGYAELQNNGDTNVGLDQVSRAFDLSSDDMFARKMALFGQGEIVKIMQKASNGEKDLQETFERSLASAVDVGRKATTIDGTDPDNWDALGRVYATVVPLSMENAYQLSHEAFEKARTLDPQNPARLVTLAELELLQRKTSDARDYITRAIALKPNYTDASYVLAQIEISDGNVEGAINSTRTTTVLDASNPVRFFQLGVLQFSAKHYEDAATSLLRAIEMSKEYANARYFLALTYDAMGKKNEAIDQLNQVLALNPESTEVKDMLAKLSRGESLNTAGTPPVSNEPLDEASENTTTKAPATSGQAPDSSAISPVNGDTVPAE